MESANKLKNHTLRVDVT